jgi:hypothetical protein
MARTHSDVLTNRLFNIWALTALARPESLEVTRQFRDECEANEWRQFHHLSEAPWGAALIRHGDFGAGMRWLQRSISRLQGYGMVGLANVVRTALAEVYLRIILKAERAPFWVVVRNFPTLLRAGIIAESRIKALIKDVRAQPHVDREGVVYGRCEMILGLLCKAKKRRPEAVSHLTEAKRLFAQLGPTPDLNRIEQALRELR